MSLWIELETEFVFAYREPRNEDLIGRIYAYAQWCCHAPRQKDAGHDPLTAVAVAFFEDIPEIPAAREDMPRWFTVEDVAGSKEMFSYHIGEEAFKSLLANMRNNAHRYAGHSPMQP